jgi:hypothetical protein
MREQDERRHTMDRESSRQQGFGSRDNGSDQHDATI